MSTYLAIAAVTTALRDLLDAEIKVVDTNSQVTMQPPDKTANDKNKLNLFLFNVSVNAALRTMPELSVRVRPGETALPPLALDLYYLLSAYGTGQPHVWDDRGHRLLGRAMSFLHDHAVLLREDLQTALADAGVHEQVERVRVTLQPLSLEEMSKLWTTFQTQYRLSVAYCVSVVLIESDEPARTPLPVLSIGPDDRGVQSQPDLTPPLPTLTGIVLPAWSSEPVGGLLPEQRPSAELGNTLTLRGLHLDGLDVEVIFSHPRLEEPNVLAPKPDATARALEVTVPDQPADWPAGVYTVSVALIRSGQRHMTNGLPLVLSPRILTRTPASTGATDFSVTITFTPQVHSGQHVALLFGSRELLPSAFAPPTGTLSFPVQGAEPGVYPLRLRVDGADSQIVQVAGTPPAPGFDPGQTVEVTP
jgi:hypothetical protein